VNFPVNFFKFCPKNGRENCHNPILKITVCTSVFAKARILFVENCVEKVEAHLKKPLEA
jgi:hypothetical protein